MSSSEASEEKVPTEVVFQAVLSESSDEPPIEEWSSLILELPEENKKRLLYSQGLYDPGSGEVCLKYIAMSDSAVLRHPYYNYPSVNDPGIKEALLDPEDPIIYEDNGQDLYLALCEEMNLCPIGLFHRSLLEDTINLKYYGVNPVNIRAMALALHRNKTVRVFDLSDNWLSEDGCYHLGQMLVDNTTLEELILSGCRMGPEGVRKFLHGLRFNRNLRVLDMSKNQLDDDGTEHLAKAIFQGINVKKINLNYNNITGVGAAAVADSLETHNDFTHINLSWNKLFSTNTYTLLGRLSENTNLLDVDLSWNGLGEARIGNGLRILLNAPNLQTLDLSNNRLRGEAITAICRGLVKAKKLNTLNLSFNPLLPEDSIKLLEKLGLQTVNLQTLLLDNVCVTPEFLNLRKQILGLEFRVNAVITYGDVIHNYTVVGPDCRDLVIRRADFLAKKPKKNPLDVCLILMALVKEDPSPMLLKNLIFKLRKMGCQLDNELVDEIANIFPGLGSTPKNKTVDMVALVDYMKRKWPDRQLPSTPPPAPETKSKKGKGKKKK